VLLGAGTALLRRDRASKLVLWWAALYPVAPSLMNEIPSATRGIMGAPMFALLGGIGFAAALRALRWLITPSPSRSTAAAPVDGVMRPRRRARWARVIQGIAIAAAAVPFGYEVATYLHAYFVEYPTYAALTPGGFQYGYRDMINYMESQRANYDVLLLSATDSNQPQVCAVLSPHRSARMDEPPRFRLLDRQTGRVFAIFARPTRVAGCIPTTSICSATSTSRSASRAGRQAGVVVAEVKGRKQISRTGRFSASF
jgi:hypothetical protein